MTNNTADDTVAFDVQDGIAWVRFNRPEKRNCMSPRLNREMLRVLDMLEFRDDVGVLVLSGEGTAWSAGMDLKEYFRDTEAQGLQGVRQSQREAYAWWKRLRWYQKVTIAMINGWWWWWTAPTVIILTVFLGLFFLAVGLDEIANPRLRRSA